MIHTPVLGFINFFDISCVAVKIHETVTSKNTGNHQHTKVENVSEFIHIINVVLCTKLYKKEPHLLSNNQNQQKHWFYHAFQVGA
jgi:hypothetical protein